MKKYLVVSSENGNDFYIVDDLKAAGALVLTIESPDNDETFVDVAMSDQQLRKFQSEWGMANAKDDWSVEAL
jgi:hypothetical protein